MVVDFQGVCIQEYGPVPVHTENVQCNIIRPFKKKVCIYIYYITPQPKDIINIMGINKLKTKARLLQFLEQIFICLKLMQSTVETCLPL